MVDKLAKKMAKYHLAKELLRKVDVPPNWRVTETVLHYASPLAAAPTNKIAGFDFDHTLCSGGLTWQVASMGTKNALERLHNDGFKICVFSNQTQIGKKLEESQMHYVTHLTLRRFQTFISWLEPVPCHLFLATARGDVDDCYRKPNVKMWHLMEELNAQPALDEENKCWHWDLDIDARERRPRWLRSTWTDKLGRRSVWKKNKCYHRGGQLHA
eukprot:GEMP01082357.1.p1 GENE.GEMP01082357.1~~GEMP01082357.1.p1  ORF type:complete len:214 (+),score=60.97 GEMP01082357.1:156-797(+)